MKKVISLLILTLLQGGVCLAQNQFFRELKQKQQPQGFDNHSFGVFYYNGNERKEPGETVADKTLLDELRELVGCDPPLVAHDLGADIALAFHSLFNTRIG